MSRRSRELLDQNLHRRTHSLNRPIQLPVRLTRSIMQTGIGECMPFGDVILPFRITGLSLSPAALATMGDMQAVFGTLPQSREIDYSVSAWGVSICAHSSQSNHPWNVNVKSTQNVAPLLSIPFMLLKLNSIAGPGFGLAGSTDEALRATGGKPANAPTVEFRSLVFLREKPIVIVHGPQLRTSAQFHLDLLIEVQ